LEDGAPAFTPNFEDAVKTDAVCEAVLQSAKDKTWKTIDYKGA
jgi:hypothetical protein